MFSILNIILNVKRTKQWPDYGAIRIAVCNRAKGGKVLIFMPDT